MASFSLWHKGEQARPEAELQLLVEVAVVDAAVPADTNSGAAHDGFGRGCVEAAQKQRHVALQLALALQVIYIALDGHVVQAQQAIERDAVRLCKLRLVSLLQSAEGLPIRKRLQERWSYCVFRLEMFGKIS